MKIAVVTVVPHGATEPGALDGWVVHCDQCGEMGGSSLQGMADQQAMGHRHWHMIRDSERLIEMQEAVASDVRLMLWRVGNASMVFDDGDMEDIGQLGNVLNALLNPDHPEVQELLPAIRSGVDMFINELRSQ